MEERRQNIIGFARNRIEQNREKSWLDSARGQILITGVAKYLN